MSKTFNRVFSDQWTEQTVCVGVSGMGKSYLAKAYVESISQFQETKLRYFSRRVVVYDPQGWWERRGFLNRFPFGEWHTYRERYPFLRFEDVESLRSAMRYERNAIFVFDETQLVPQSEWSALLNLSVSRRHRDLEILFLTTRPVSIPPPVMANASRFALFHIHDKRDLKHLDAVIPQEDLEVLPSLNEREYRDIIVGKREPGREAPPFPF